MKVVTPMERWCARVRLTMAKRCHRTAQGADDGMTLLELLAAVLIASLVSAVLVALFGAVLGVYGAVGGGAIGLSDSSRAYWMLEKLAQNTVALGTVDPSSPQTFVAGPTAGPVPVLALKVTNLQGIAPSSTPVYSAAPGGFLCVAVVPYGGRFVLGLFPGGLAYNPTANPPVYPPPSDVTPIFSEGSDFSGTTFQVQSASTFSAYVVTHSAGPGSPGAQSAHSVAYQFMIGLQDY